MNKMNDSKLIFRLVVKFKDYLNLPYHEPDEISCYFSLNDLLPIKCLMNLFPGLKISKLFPSLKPELIVEMAKRARRLDQFYQAPDFLAYYVISCPYELYSEEILQILLMHNKIEMAYVESGCSIPPSYEDVYNQTCIHQGYLKPAPAGIDAMYAWNIEGGDGMGLKFIDIEQGWIQDPNKFTIGTFNCTGMNLSVFKDHGEAVLGVILTQHNFIGGKGIAPKANGFVISQWRNDGSFNTADAIMVAISKLDYGDVILLEAQIYDTPGSESLWPVEIQQAVFDAIRLASSLGIIVIEAAGNGRISFGEGNDLDNYTDNYRRKPLNRSAQDFRDSGAILVAAGSDMAPHERIRISNFGSRIDCYAWGERVSTAGSHMGTSEMAINSYRNKINGTSSAATIIAGAALVVQGIAESNHHFRMSPNQMRQVLGNDLLATPSAGGRSIDRIGVMPDLKKIIDYINLASSKPQC